MPNITNITVKNVAAADVVFIARSAAAGDGSFAQWSTAGATPLQSDVLRVKTVLNGKRDGRRVEITGSFPYVVEGVVIAQQPFSISTTIPLNIPSSEGVDNAKVMSNILASSLIQEVCGYGYNAT